MKLEVKALEAAYLMYRDKWDRAKVGSIGDDSLVNIRIVDYPAIPARPSFSRLILILAAFGGSIALAICLALLKNYFDHMVYAPADIPDLDLPVVASVRYSRAGRLKVIQSQEKRFRKRRAIRATISVAPTLPRELPRSGASTTRTFHQPAG
jgi:hypothetical protein